MSGSRLSTRKRVTLTALCGPPTPAASRSGAPRGAPAAPLQAAGMRN